MKSSVWTPVDVLSFSRLNENARRKIDTYLTPTRNSSRHTGGDDEGERASEVFEPQYVAMDSRYVIQSSTSQPLSKEHRGRMPLVPSRPMLPDSGESAHSLFLKRSPAAHT